MKLMMRIISGLFLIILANAQADEPVDSLMRVQAPAGEFVRMPVQYILQKLVDTAQRSGESELSGFYFKNDLTDKGNQRISIKFDGLTLHEAMIMLSEAMGGRVEFVARGAIFVNADTIIAATEEKVSEPNQEKSTQERIQFLEINRALVFVENGDGRGSAFVAKMNGTTYVMSNQHNILGATDLVLRSMNGIVFSPVGFEYCKERDLVRFELSPAESKGLTSLSISEEIPNIGDRVAVYGNSAGGGVATELLGKIEGVGPRVIEIDADIVPGNSGSPVMDAEGNVFGVATYITVSQKFKKGDIRSKIYSGTRFNKERRYAVRIPMDGWVKEPITDYLAQSYLLDDVKSILEATHILTQSWNGNKDFEEQTIALFQAYSSIVAGDNPPYKMNEKESEMRLQMMVRAIESCESEINLKLHKKEKFDDLSNSNKEMLGGRITQVLLKSVDVSVKELKETAWKSHLLKEQAKPLEQFATLIKREIESPRNPYIKFVKNKR